MPKVAMQENNKIDGDDVIIEPLVLQSVKVVTTTKNIEVPKYIEKDYELPVITEVPSTKYIKNEEPTTKYIKQEEETIKYVKNEVPYDIDVPVPVEKPYDVPVPVPNEVPYDLPVVSMEKVKEIASEATFILSEAKGMLKELNDSMVAFRKVTDSFDKTMEDVKKKLSEVTNYEIVEEKYPVRVPDLKKYKVEVIGKILAREPYNG